MKDSLIYVRHTPSIKDHGISLVKDSAPMSQKNFLDQIFFQLEEFYGPGSIPISGLQMDILMQEQGRWGLGLYFENG
jgi:hypothetical protein